MAKRTAASAYPLDRFENVAQIGGVQTSVLDNGLGRGSRIASVNTGAGLRYDLALDRGADVLGAFYQQYGLAYLTQNGVRPPNHAYSEEWEWLAGWPGGLVTTCGPVHFGHPRDEADGQRMRTNLHGRFSNQPAQIVAIHEPDPHHGRLEMGVDAVIRDSRTFGPVVEVCRSIRSTLGENEIRITDTATNRNNTLTAFGMMYHCNFGWPLLDAGAKLVLKGKVKLWPADMQTGPVPDKLEGFKAIPAPSKVFNTTSRGFICEPSADQAGMARVGVVNGKLNLAVELAFPVKEVPRVMIWQHFAQGSYVMGIEPLAGTPFGKAEEPKHALSLAPGQTRRTQLFVRVHGDAKSVAAFEKNDGPLSLS